MNSSGELSSEMSVQCVREVLGVQGGEDGAAALAQGPAARHNKGCNCKKSGCLKKYCECFQASIFCSDNCKCIDCKNFEVRLGSRCTLWQSSHSSGTIPDLRALLHTRGTFFAHLRGPMPTMHVHVLNPNAR